MKRDRRFLRGAGPALRPILKAHNLKSASAVSSAFRPPHFIANLFGVTGPALEVGIASTVPEVTGHMPRHSATDFVSANVVPARPVMTLAPTAREVVPASLSRSRSHRGHDVRRSEGAQKQRRRERVPPEGRCVYCVHLVASSEPNRGPPILPRGAARRQGPSPSPAAVALLLGDRLAEAAQVFGEVLEFGEAIFHVQHGRLVIDVHLGCKRKCRDRRRVDVDQTPLRVPR